MWAYHERPGPGGTRWADIDRCLALEDYLADLAAEDGGLVAAARAFVPGFEGLTAEEPRAVAALVELADVIGLREGPGALTRLLAAAEAPRHPRAGRKAEPPLALEPKPEDSSTEPPTDAVVRLSAARRARRHALRQTWK